MIDRNQTVCRLFPMAEGYRAFGGVGQHHDQSRAELAPTMQAQLQLGLGSAGSRGRIRIQNLVAFAISDLLACSSYLVQTFAHRPAAFLQHLRTVVEALCDAGGEEIGQMGQDHNRKPARHIHHVLLRGGIRRGRGGQFAGRRVKEGRLVGQQLQGQDNAGAQCETGGKPV